MRHTPKFTLRRVRGKPNYYITWSERGRSKRISTGTPDEAAAQRYLSDFAKGWIAPPDEQDITVNAMLDIYLAYKEEDYRIKGEPHRNYVNLAGSAKSIREFFGNLHVSQVSNELGRAYIASMQKKGLSNATTRKYIATLNAAINHGISEKMIAHQPSVKMPPKPPSRSKWMTPEQAAHFMTHVHQPHLEVFCLLGLHTLARKGAILSLTWDRVLMDMRLIDFCDPTRTHTTKRRVKSPINTRLYAALDRALMIAQTDYVVEYNGKPVGNIRRSFNEAAERAGLSWVTPHTLRHTGISLLVQRGVPLDKVAELAGDSVKTIKDNYVHLAPEYLQQPVAMLNEIYGSIA